MIPGEYIIGNTEIICNKGKKVVCLKVSNTGDRPIQVGSHFHFFEVNKYLEFEREKAFGMRLDIPSGTAARFEPGEEKEVELVEIGGARVVYGFNALACGDIKEKSVKDAGIKRAKELGFKGGLQDEP